METHLQSLQHLHTFSLPAFCNNIQTANSVDSLIELLQEYAIQPYLVMGEGSNTIFLADFSSTVIVNRIKGVVHRQDNTNHYLQVGAGENWHELVEFCMQQNIGGFENLALIPGSVGAAPIQNIGAYGVEIERFIDSVEFVDTTDFSLQSLPNKACEFAYRDSVFKRQPTNSRIIVQVNFVLPKVYQLETSYGPLAKLTQATARQVCDEVIAIRRSKLPDPKKQGNAGSFFKNPVISNAQFKSLQAQVPAIPYYDAGDKHKKIPAAWLIDQLGFKGKQVGNIACHVHQPLVLVNLGNGTGNDLLALARNIVQKVEAEFGIHLENEVRLIGQEGLITL